MTVEDGGVNKAQLVCGSSDMMAWTQSSAGLDTAEVVLSVRGCLSNALASRGQHGRPAAEAPDPGGPPAHRHPEAVRDPAQSETQDREVKQYSCIIRGVIEILRKFLQYMEKMSIDTSNFTLMNLWHYATEGCLNKVSYLELGCLSLMDGYNLFVHD